MPLNIGIIYCNFCNHQCKTFSSHILHQKYHQNINKLFYCGFNKCSKRFINISNLSRHMIKTHGVSSKKSSKINVNCNDERGNYICTVEVCKQECDTYANLIKHLKDHINKHEQIKCPYKNCTKKYLIIKSFTSHLTKYHRKLVDQQLIDDGESVVQNNPQNKKKILEIEEAGVNYEYIEYATLPNDPNDNENIMELDHSALFLNNTAEFYLKLESELLLPSSTIQYICQAVNTSHILAEDIMTDKLKKCLEDENIPIHSISKVVKLIREGHPHVAANKTLETNYKRKKYFKNSFNFVQPLSINIDKKKQTFFSYVPLKDTIINFFKDKSLVNEIIFRDSNESDILEDFNDGIVYKNNLFFQNKDTKRIKIILYQDEFELVNPIGPAKKIHKLLAVYMSLGNIPSHLRTHVNNIKLVTLCKVTDFDHEKVYGRIVQDLIDIESNGLNINGELIKGTLVYSSGDNLGSHALGGYAENFSKVKYICRYCLMSKEEFLQVGGACKFYEKRTKESYDAAVAFIERKNKEEIKRLNTNNELKNKRKKKVIVYKGIKFSSVFNKLKNYHVASGLPPCLGHDWFEGVLAYDLKLCLDYLIKNRWITFEELNNLIENFPYSPEDKNDKPLKFMMKSSKIAGGACQIWTLLKVLPLLLKGKIADKNNDVWKLILGLTEISEMICAPRIHKSVLPYLQVCITDYIDRRQFLFSEVPLRPKHHYLMHYPELILEFGPLMKVWTLRYESKHRYFKRAIRYTMNFINVTKSLAEKHELFQSLISLGADARSELQLLQISAFEMDLYSSVIQHTIRLNVIGNIDQCEKVVYKGTEYKKGDALTIQQTIYKYDAKFGKMLLFLINDDTIYVVLEILQTEYLPEIATYEITESLLNRTYKCMALNEIVDYKPLHIYKLEDMNCIKPSQIVLFDDFKLK